MPPAHPPVSIRAIDSALLSALADPATYDGAPVAVHETHALWVFVAGGHAYKVKKPVALGFLDYSTLERRRLMCHEEVRVNRELAPGIYLGVRAIVSAGTGFAFAADDGAPGAVEYAVLMRSFDEADTLAGLIAREELRAEHLRAVAQRLVAFHRDAPVVPGGEAEALLDAWRLNLRELRDVDRALGLPAEIAEDFGEAFVHAHASELERRREAGLVRDGHGDLRCEHVLAIPEVRIVDRIEFDPGLRHGDVARDLAFLTMDLEARDQRWAAAALLAEYRAGGIDAGSEALLSFYGAYLALVRAKVALVAAAEHAGEGEDQEERSAQALAQARSMWALAEHLCWRARAPAALVVCGPAASGKSTLAAELARRSGYEVLSSDAVRKAAAGLAATERAAPEHYSHRFTHRIYELLAGRAQELLRDGAGVIVDATCRSRAERSTLLGRLARAGMPRLVVRCELPLELALERAALRERDSARVSDAGPQIVAEQFRSFEPLEELPPEDVLALNTAQPLDAQAAAVMHALDRRR